MSGWALTSPGMTEVDRFDPATTENRKVTVTASGTVNTKGSWTELLASTSQDCHLLGVGVYNTRVSGSNTGTLVDIGIGGSGSETVLISNLLAGYKPFLSGGVSSEAHQVGSAFPIFVPAGSRLSARSQAVIVSDTVEVGVRLLSSPNSFVSDQRQGGNVITYGADAANSRGTLISAPGTAHTKSSWVEMTASTTQPHSALIATVQGHTSTFQKYQTMLVDVGFGASGSEEVLIPDIFVMSWGTEGIFILDADLGAMSIGRTIPVGTRLAMRAQYSTTLGGDLSVCLHGVT